MRDSFPVTGSADRDRMSMPSNALHDTPHHRSSPRQVLLGLFITAQLLFLVLVNLLGFYQDAQPYVPAPVGEVIDRVAPGYVSKGGHTWQVPDEVATAVRRWTELTGQDQRWALFAPGVYQVTGFPALVLRWEPDATSLPALGRTVLLLAAQDGLQAVAAANLLQLQPDELSPAPVRMVVPAMAPFAAASPLDAATLATAALDRAASEPPSPFPPADLFMSDNEPPDRNAFLRVGRFRLRRLESNLIPYLTQRDDETPQTARERWVNAIKDHVARNTDALHAYLKWRLESYRSLHPDRPMPQQVILVERVYPILSPEENSGACWRGPETHPLARWQPAIIWQSDYRPLERYNPVTERFESLPR